MERTTDGFELAEVDLELRGEGTILGARQKGRSDLKLAKLLSDQDLVADARTMAEALVAEDPDLHEPRAPGRRAPHLHRRRRGRVPVQELMLGFGS